MRVFNHLKSDWFRYGFETIAVVVGILVAFALDNWNEVRKQEILEIQYLNGLKADLASDTAYYNRRIGDSEGVLQDNTNHILQMYQNQNSLGEVKNLISLANWNSEQLTTQNSTYIDLINSGSLSTIRNQVLKDLVIDYYRENETAAAHILEFNEVSSRSLLETGNVIRNYGKFWHFNDDLYDDEDTQKDKYLTFCIGSEDYGIAIANVTEIIGIQNINEVPDMPDFIKGVINLRGKVIPVMDVRTRFRLESKDYDERTCIIVVEIGGAAVGLVVDEVSEVADIPQNQVEPPPRIAKSDSSRYLKGMGKMDENVKILLNVDRLLQDEEIEQLDQQQ